MKIRDHVDIAAQPSVVRLDHLQEADADWISDSYYITEESGRHFKAIRTLLGKKTGCGIFLIGHYGSGKSHFLAYLVQQLLAGTFAPRTPSVLPLSLLNFKASQSLESIVAGLIGLPSEESDRRKEWAAVEKLFPDGVLLVLDELSEFLRSKPTAQSFNEDLRFLQFLGEWTQAHPLWILAAMQEQIEHTGEIEYDLFRKIKDRYPLRLLLTTTHVRDLIAQRLLRKRPSYAPAVEKLAADLKEIYPESSIDYGELCEIYPLHPITLELLEEVRDRFSQARGIIDFTLTQLLGNEARNIAPFLDQPWGSFVTPNLIVDHFSDLFEVQPEFLAIAQKVLPYYRRQVPVLFEKQAQQDLAWSLLKLLILVHLSPRRKSLSVDEAALWLLLKVSTVDPGRNREVVHRMLDTLCQRGAFLKRQESRYRLDLEDDSNEYLNQLLAKTVEELQGRAEYVFESLISILEQTEFNPFVLPRDRWHARKIRWHFHEWDLQIYFGGGKPEVQKGHLLRIGVPWGPQVEADHCFQILPKQLELSAEILELAALQNLKDRPLSARVLGRIRERVASRSSWYASLIRQAYADALVLDSTGARAIPPANPLQVGVAGWLTTYGEWILRQTYPLFEGFAPGHGPLPKEAYREFMKFASESDLGAELAPEYVKLIREAYLVPLGLMQRRGSEYVMNRKLDTHDIVRLLLPIVEHHPTPARVYQHLSAPLYGLVPDQIHLLLMTLVIQGEIDIVKGDHSYREIYDTLINPLQYDRIIPGQVLNLNQLRDLQILCDGLHVAVPKQWSVLAQRRAIEQLRKLGARQRDQLSEFKGKLDSFGEAGEIEERVDKLISQWNALDKGEHELQGLDHFLFAIGSPRRFVAESDEVASLAPRFERLLRESQRYRHLFSYPCVLHCADEEIAEAVGSLQMPPSPAQTQLLEAWVQKAEAVYRRYKEWYTVQHDSWCKTMEAHKAWTFRIQTVCRSKHLAASGQLRSLESLLAEIRNAHCAGLGSLEFQPMCRCGFDGVKAPLSEILVRFDEASSRLEREMTVFFQQDTLKKKVREWVAQGMEVNTKTLSYLEGKAKYPEVENLALFDQHLAGLELVQNVPADTLLDLLGERTWERSSLIHTLGQFLDRFGPRISFRNERLAPRKELVSWCCEQGLRSGRALPDAFTSAERLLIPDLIQPQWITEPALRNLEQMGLGEKGVLRVLDMLLNGMIQCPEPPPLTGAVAAALELLHPTRPASVEGMVSRILCLYEQNERFLKLRPPPWLALLENWASSTLPQMPENLDCVLRNHIAAQWVVIDCMGLLLQKMIKAILPLSLPRWDLRSIEFGLVSEQTSTDAFYLGLIEGDLNRPFEKINAVDDLIHERRVNFTDLVKLAKVELEVALKNVLPRLDPTRPLVLFGDHGFRLAPDGQGFTHGGRSTLERITPIFVLHPDS